MHAVAAAMNESIAPHPTRAWFKPGEGLIDAIDLPIGRWDRDHRLVFCNAPYALWAGRPASSLLGRTLADLFGDSAWAAARNAFAAAFAGRAARYERRLTHQGSGSHWARMQVFPDRAENGRIEHVCTLAMDIHEDVMQREALEDTRRRLDRFTDNIPYPLTYVDAACVIRFVNRAYVDAAHQPASALLGRHIASGRGASRWAEHKPFVERALAGEAVQYTRLVDNLPGGPRWLRTSYVPDFDADHQVAGLYTVTIDVHELTLAQERLKREVQHDELTGTLSRRTLMDRIDAAVSSAGEQPLALFFVDLDGFKPVNDSLGHTVGDALLKAVAVALQGAVRADDAVGRFGGDEFLVLAKVRDAAGAHTLALHMLEAVRGCNWLPGGGTHVGASIGYALAPGDATQPMRLLQLADEAMYAAKRAGKNRALHASVDGR
jgi:diguanylate cyclase (GGDEF)-like protein/PAS domain S-box-containing protein